MWFAGVWMIGLLGVPMSEILAAKPGAPVPGEARTHGIAMADVVGERWSGSCEEANLLGRSFRRSLSFMRGKLDDMFTIFEDEKCTKAALEIEFIGDYEITEARQDFASPVDFSYEEVMLRPLTEDIAKALAMVRFCGVARWKVNSPQTLTRQSESASCPIQETPLKVLDLVGMEGNVLYLGKPGMPSEGGNQRARPAELEFSAPFSRKGL